MSDEPLIGHGTKLLRGVGSPTIYGELARVSEIVTPGLSKDAVDVTHLKSVQRFKEFISGMRDGGEVTFVVIYNPNNATHAQLDTDYLSDSLQEYRITLPTTPVWSWDFDCVITALGTATPIDDKMTRSVTLKVSGVPVLHQVG